MRKLREKHENEYRIFGPPGTGKTTYITEQIHKAAEKHGPDSICVSSFTKAAAENLAGKDLPIPAQNLGTLHAHCYRGLGFPEIAETKIDEFNKDFPDYQLTVKKGSNTDESASDQNFNTEGDKLFSEYQILRARMTPKEAWPASVRALDNKWTEFKQSADLVDFTDMIEISVKNMLFPPGGATIGFFDEAQDFTPLQLELVRAWGTQLDYFLLAGDDDQTLYTFAGATPDSFLKPEIPDDRKRVLPQSYRVPRAVQNLAENVIQRVSFRENKPYKPKDEEGLIRNIDANSKKPEQLIKDVEEQLTKNKTCMVIASCSYMLHVAIASLKEKGIPFSNLYRPNRGDWNPLTPTKGTSTKQRILDYLKPEGPVLGDVRLWTPEQLASWLELIKVKGILNNGYKKKLQDAPNNLNIEQYTDLLLDAFDPEKLDQAVKLDHGWLFENMTAQKKKSAQYPLNVIVKGKEFKDSPRLTLGTIHSVKGGQADCVYLYPDLSMNAARGYVSNTETRDSVIRQFYVGITRAKQELALLEPTNPKLSFEF